MDIERAYHKAEKILLSEAISPEDFSEFYSPEEIAADMAYVKRMEGKFSESGERSEPEEKELHQLATTFEAIFYEQGELSNWLGEEATTIRCSRYDDIANGVDGIVRLGAEEDIAHLGLIIDVTTAENLDEKFFRIKNEIKSGELAHVKYFKPEESSLPGLPHIPRVVIGAGRDTIKELSNLWMNGENRKLGEHPVQLRIIKEIVSQIKTFNDYAAEIGREELCDNFQRILGFLEPILAEKKRSIKDTREYDPVFSAIQMQLERFSDKKEKHVNR